MFKNNESINSLELANITKKVFILFIKDLITLTSSNKELSIEKALTQLQKGVPSPLPTTPIGVERLGGLTPASIKTPFGSGIGRFDLSKPTRLRSPGRRDDEVPGYGSDATIERLRTTELWQLP